MKRLSLFVFFFSGFVLILSIMTFAQEKKILETQTYLKTVRYGISLVKDKDYNRFLDIQYSDLPRSVRSQSENYLTRVLKTGALPQKSTHFATRYFLAYKNTEYDLLEYKWSFSGHSLRIVESLNAVKLEIPLKFTESLSRTVFAKSAVESIVNLRGIDAYGQNYRIELQWPNSLNDGVTFSSNPQENIVSISHWHDRIDIFVKDDLVSLIFYKKIPQLLGYQNGFGWISQHVEKK